MGGNKFEEIVKMLVVKYVNNHIDKSDKIKITKDNVYIVWSCKTL